MKALLEAGDRKTALATARENRALVTDELMTLLRTAFKDTLGKGTQESDRVATASAVVAQLLASEPARSLAKSQQGIVAHLRGRQAVARRNLLEASAGLESLGMYLEAADVQRILIQVCKDLGRYRDGLDAARRARRLHERSGGAEAWRSAALAMNLGNLHHNRDEHARALSCYVEARRLYVRAGNTLKAALADFNRANILTSLDRTPEARRLYESARAEFVSSGRDALVATSEYGLAGLDLLEGRLDTALSRLEASRDRSERLEDEPGCAHADLDAAEALLRLNRPLEAEEKARRAQAFFRRAEQEVEMARALALRGGAAFQRGRLETAVDLLRESGDLYLEEGNRVAAATTEVGLSRALRSLGDIDEAIELAKRASKVLKTRGLLSRGAHADVACAEAALEADRSRLALSRAEAGLKSGRKVKDLKVQVAALLVLAELEERKQPGSPAAYRRLLAAERLVQKLRLGVTAEESRIAFAIDKVGVYEALVLNRLAREEPRSAREALAWAERGKARALAERLARRRGGGLGLSAAGAQRLASRLDDLDRRLAVASARIEEGGAERIGKRSANPDSIARDRLAVVDELVRRHPEHREALGRTTTDPLALVESLPRDETVVEYHEAGGSFHAFVVMRGSVVAFPRLARSREILELCSMLRFQLGKGVLGVDHQEHFGRFLDTTLRSYLAMLHELLIAPLAGHLKGSMLRIVPHGALHGIPFHAFEDRGVTLGERFVVSYAPSLAVAAILSTRRGQAAGAPILLGAADAAAPAIDAEIAAVQRHLPGALVVAGEQLTARALTHGGGRPPLLHVASHGFFAESSKTTGALRIGGEWMGLEDILRMKTTAELVVLSGCHTGRGIIHSGDEWIGLVRGFLQAGARTVVASLWEVHDEITAQLMDEFYGYLLEGASIAEALGKAQARARAAGQGPLHWAPFHVVGDPSLTLRLQKAA